MENGTYDTISEIKRLARDFFILSAFGVILVKLRGILFVKIFSTFLGIADYGYFFFIQNNGLTLAALVSFNMQTAVYRFTAESMAKNNKNQSFIILMTAIIMSLLIAVFIMISMLILTFFNITIFTSNTYYFDIISMGAFGLVIGIDTILLEFFRSRQDKALFFSLQTIIPYLTLAGSIILGIILNLSVIGLILASLVGYLILILPIIVRIFLQSKESKFSTLEAKRILKFSIPGMTVICVATLKIFVLNLLLKAIFGNSALGTYSIALSTANIFGMFDYIISLSYPTIIMKNYDLGNHEYIQNLVIKITRIYMVIIIAATLILSAFSPILILIFSSPEYLNSALLIPILLFALDFQALNNLTCFGPLLKKNMKAAGIRNTLSHSFQLIIILILVPQLGALGAALSFLLFHIVTFILNFRLSQTEYPIEYNKSKFGSLIFSIFLSLFIGLFFVQLNNSLFYISFLVSITLFGLLVIVFRLLTPQEIKRVISILKSPNF